MDGLDICSLRGPPPGPVAVHASVSTPAQTEWVGSVGWRGAPWISLQASSLSGPAKCRTINGFRQVKMRHLDTRAWGSVRRGGVGGSNLNRGRRARPPSDPSSPSPPSSELTSFLHSPPSQALMVEREQPVLSKHKDRSCQRVAMATASLSPATSRSMALPIMANGGIQLAGPLLVHGRPPGRASVGLHWADRVDPSWQHFKDHLTGPQRGAVFGFLGV
ncbi:unnamed protein product [Pleuronectes platessa]|uniref:Uncharacterized protein n=1 Tax=Pleuronectes platessa TaxID=8262 RepID=A0A9N7VHY9_PLEPL|nr:unnamed protein product [Pleuronectes platessa]